MLNPFASPGGPTVLELARQCLSSLESGYDQLSGKFDSSVFRTPTPILEALAAQVPPEAQRLLDIGCGTGAVLQHVARVPRREGIDLSRGMLCRARAALGPGPRLWQGDFLNTHWESQFDCITSIGALGHIPVREQLQFFRAVAKALTPEGQFLTVAAGLEGRPLMHAAAWCFDQLMRLRNLLWRPRFVMYYLSFTLPSGLSTLEKAGLQATVTPDLFPPPYQQLQLVQARRRYPQALTAESPIETIRT